MKKEKRIRFCLHVLCVFISLGCLACSVWIFPNAWIRIKESFSDLVTSVAYYLKEIFKLDYYVVPTVNDYSSIPSSPILGLPKTWEGFTEKWNGYWNLWLSKDNFTAYLNFIGNGIYNVCKVIVLFVIPIILISYFLFRAYLSKKNNKYGIVSKPLYLYMFVLKITYYPMKKFILCFWNFIQQHDTYYKFWALIWAWNFNLITIFIEFLAFYYYFCASFDVLNIYRQVYKLFCDLSVMLSFVPFPVWIITGLLFFFSWRKKIAYKKLMHFERKNCGFINERPIVMMVCGTMGKKKTTAITDMALSQDVMLKDKAFEKILENDLKFPYFPWINLENALRDAMSKHQVYNLATCKEYTQLLKKCFYVGSQKKETKATILQFLQKKYDLNYDNLLFDYDYKRYGLTFDNKLEVVDVWQVIETYAQLYFIYIIQSSLIIANYSIRTDNLIEDVGNFPLWNTDFFKRDSRLIDSFSRHSHIIDFDALRLGRKIIQNNPNKDSFEFGVVNITEIGKERKNQLELREMKKNEEVTNQKNDGFTDWLKMVRHSATVDNFPFVKIIADEQRPESLGADARDLCEIVHIKESGETKLAMPFFALAELLYDFVLVIFTNLYYKYRFNRSDSTLPMFLIKSFCAKLHNYYKGIYNIFGYCTLKIQVENGTQDGIKKDKKYYLMSKKIYSKRFSTDCFSEFFTQKSLQSKVGIDDMKEYKTEKATFEELKSQNSYFINDLTNKTDKDN